MKRAIRAACVVLGAACTSAGVSALRALGTQHRFNATHQLFLVFRPVAGGPTNNVFNLNWVEFTDPGISVNAA
jgi:hypothetical protein